MTKKEKEKPVINGIILDSDEELQFYNWCIEAKNKNIIEDFIYHPPSYQLSESVKYEEEVVLKTKTKKILKHLLFDHVYTPDFKIIITEKFKKYFPKHDLFSHTNEIVIDVKGAFQKFDGARSFSINQKWVYDKHKVYVNKIIPKKFFLLTFVPKNVLVTRKTGKIKNAYSKCKTIDDFQ